jgi:hypothetical protein
MDAGIFKRQCVQASVYVILQHRSMKVGVNSRPQPGQSPSITQQEIQYKKEHVHA